MFILVASLHDPHALRMKPTREDLIGSLLQLMSFDTERARRDGGGPALTTARGLQGGVCAVVKSMALQRTLFQPDDTEARWLNTFLVPPGGVAQCRTARDGHESYDS
jgi:hypothetical protein